MSKKLIKKKQKNKYGPDSPYYEYIEQGLTPEQIDYILSQERPASITQDLLMQQVNNIPKVANKQISEYFHKKGYDQFVYIDKPDVDYTNHWLYEQNIDPTVYQNVLDQIDSHFNREYDLGHLKLNNTPNVNVVDFPYLTLYTYRLGSKAYPISHSKIKGYGITVDKYMDDPNYNIIFNNCAKATYDLLADLYGEEFTKHMNRPVMYLPWNVEAAAMKIPGAKFYKEDGYTKVTIPIKDYTKFKRLKYSTSLGEYYNGYGEIRDWRQVPSLNPDWKQYIKKDQAD